MDLPFAVFFLHNMIKQTHSVLYSSLDELHSLDPELSKSLHFIKVRRGVSEEGRKFAHCVHDQVHNVFTRICRHI